MWALYLFNILVNGILEFLFAYAIVLFFLKIIKIKPSPLLLAILCLPIMKLLFHMLSGVPQSSVLNAPNFLDVDFPLPRGSFLRAGAGLSWHGPSVFLEFATRLWPHGTTEYGMSLPDMVSLWFNKRTQGWGTAFIACTLVSVAVVFVIRDLISYFRFENARHRQRHLGVVLIEDKHRYPNVDMYVSPAHRGTPFTGGFLRPYICFPQETFDLLDRSERLSVLAHEAAHIRNFDLWTNLLTCMIGRIFWFVPGYTNLLRRIAKLREILADDRARREGANPAALASALLKIEEAQIGRLTHLHAAFSKTQSLVAVRINRLIEGHEPVQRSRVRTFAGFVLILIFSAFILTSSFVSNREISVEQWMPTKKE